MALRAGDLGSTLQAQDLQDGHLFTDIGLAVMRPAEFIVLRLTDFSDLLRARRDRGVPLAGAGRCRAHAGG